MDGTVTCSALAWYRRNVCIPLRHTHGEPGELDCLLDTLTALRARRLAAKLRASR